MIDERVVLLIRSLDAGGAERQVVELAKGLHRAGVAVSVVTFYEAGSFAADLERSGVPRYSVGKRGRWDLIGFGLRLATLLRRLRPTLLYSFLTTANLLAVLVKPTLRRARLVWGLRASDMDMSRYDWLARLTYRLEPEFSRWADLIIANSEAGRRQAIALGYAPSKFSVVPNGVDTDRFRRTVTERQRVRAEWGLREAETVVGLAARLDPMKDHQTFLQAAALISRTNPLVAFVLVGAGSPSRRQALEALALQLTPRARVIWCGLRDDMPAVLSAFDIACSASAFGEGFSNAIAEAMACEVPCVGTDVGDTASLIGDAGLVVPPGDPDKLSSAISSLLLKSTEERAELGRKARERIVDNFGIQALVRRTRTAWRSAN